MNQNTKVMIIQETHLVEYKNRVIPLYRGVSKINKLPVNDIKWKEERFTWYAQFGNVSEYDGAQVVEFEELSEDVAMELIKNSKI